MNKLRFAVVLLPLCAVATAAFGDDWRQFRGPGGNAVSDEKGLPVVWSSTKNIVWKTKLPGPGTSSPIALGEHIYVTSYSGYGLKPGEGEMENLRRHVLCLKRKSGDIVWQKAFKPVLPESGYTGGNRARHGYASSTPATDGKHLFVFFGKSGVYCLDLKGTEKWNTEVGGGTHGWGSATSPVLFENLVIVNASVESRSLVALNKETGKEVWRVENIRSSWNTPILVPVDANRTDLVVCASNKIFGIDPATGAERWQCEGFPRYVCPSAVAHDGVVYCMSHTTMMAVKAGGKGDVTGSHILWRTKRGSVVTSPVYYKGHIYWARNGGRAYCLDAKTGDVVYEERLQPQPGIIYASPVAADGKIYYQSQHDGVFVVAAEPKFRQLAHNTFEDDGSRTNACPVVDDGRLLLRTDAYLYCVDSAK